MMMMIFMNNQFKPLRFDELSFNCTSSGVKRFTQDGTKYVSVEHTFNNFNEYSRFIALCVNDCCCVRLWHNSDYSIVILTRNFIHDGLVETFFVKVNYKPSLIKKVKNVSSC